MEYEIQDVPEKTYAVIKRTVAFSDVPTVMSELIGKVQSWADAVPHGAHMCISSRTSDGQLNIAPGVEVEPGSIEPPEGFDLVTRPAQRSAVSPLRRVLRRAAGRLREVLRPAAERRVHGEGRADRDLREARPGARDPDHLADELNALIPTGREPVTGTRTRRSAFVVASRPRYAARSRPTSRRSRERPLQRLRWCEAEACRDHLLMLRPRPNVLAHRLVADRAAGCGMVDLPSAPRACRRCTERC